jgi:hypothetical protein
MGGNRLRNNPGRRCYSPHRGGRCRRQQWLAQSRKPSCPYYETSHTGRKWIRWLRICSCPVPSARAAGLRRRARLANNHDAECRNHAVFVRRVGFLLDCLSRIRKLSLSEYLVSFFFGTSVVPLFARYWSERRSTHDQADCLVYLLLFPRWILHRFAGVDVRRRVVEDCRLVTMRCPTGKY